MKILARHSLKSRVALFTLAIFLFCMWLLALYSREVQRDTMHQTLGEHQFSTASFIAAGISRELDDRFRALASVAGSITPESLADPTRLPATLDQLPVFQSLFGGRTFFARRNGVALASAALRAHAGDLGFMTGLVASALEGKSTIGQPFVGNQSSVPMVGVAVPIRDAEGNVIGALGGVLDLRKSRFFDELANNNYRKTGDYLLIAPRHRLVLDATDRNRIMGSLPARAADPLADRLIEGGEGFGAVLDRRGVAMLASVKDIPLAGWRVVLVLSTEDAFGPFHFARTRLLLAAVFLSLLGAGLTWLMVRRQLAPMVAASRTLAAYSEADQPMPPLEINTQDELGELLTAFNRLLETLRQRQDALAASEERARCMADMSADFYWESDAKHRLTQRVAGKREANELGFHPASWIGLRRWEMPSLLPDEAGWKAHREMLDSHLPFRYFEIARLRSCGSVRHVSVSGDPLFDADGNFKGYRGIGTDITERKQIELALLSSERRLAAVLDGVQSAVVTITEHGVIESFNESAVQMFGYSPLEAVGNNIKMLMPQPYRAKHDEYLENYQRTGIKKIIGRRREVMGRRKDGSIFPIELGVYETFLNDQKLFIGSISDISFRKAAEAELRIAAHAFESQQAMMITDANGVILRVNQAFIEGTGYQAEEVVGHTPRMLKSNRHGAEFYRAMWDAIHLHGGWQGEIWDRRKNGEIYPKWLTITAVKDEAGVVTHYVGTHFDVTERKQNEERVRQLAFYDSLTELPNRRLLIDRLNQTIGASRRSGCYNALMFLDLDNFKTLNDTHGHAVGDLLLVEAAARLKRSVRETDTVARFGGDEFVVMLSHLDADKAEAALQATVVAEKICAILCKPYVLALMRDGKAEATVEHHCTVSIGVVLFNNCDVRQDDILRWADKAMYQAKQGGRNAIRLHQQDR